MQKTNSQKLAKKPLVSFSELETFFSSSTSNLLWQSVKHISRNADSCFLVEPATFWEKQTDTAIFNNFWVWSQLISNSVQLLRSTVYWRSAFLLKNMISIEQGDQKRVKKPRRGKIPKCITLWFLKRHNSLQN